MYSRIIFPALIVGAFLAAPRAAAAQDMTSCTGWERLAIYVEQIAEGHFRLREKAEITCDAFKFFADYVEVFTNEDRLVAEGNVLFTTPDTRISAAKVEFNLKTKTGVFYDATGSAKVKPQIGTKSVFGTQEADMHFRGEKLERLGEKKYRITRGGFTTCLQPTARWEFTSGSVTINVDRYAVATNTIFRVKGVPLLYLPIIYYPLEEDDRATGFLLPSYGNSYIHGQTIRNAFFWAINRSMDLTVMHDWFSKTGQAYGGEFRYAATEGYGNATASFVDEKASVTNFPDGQRLVRNAGRNFQLNGEMVQHLPGRFRLGASARYFTDIIVNEVYNHNPYDYTNRQTALMANVSGQVAGLQVGGIVSRGQLFYTSLYSFRGGSAPRVTVSRPEQTLWNLPVYFGFSGEANRSINQTINRDVVTDNSRTRLDFQPTLRVPMTRSSWISLTTSLFWRTTWWSRSYDPVAAKPVPDPISRQYYEVQVEGTGPVFAGFFSTPNLGFAQRWKHVIEPSFRFSRTSPIENRSRILGEDTTDLVIGSVTRINYALVNRLYAKRGDGPSGRVRQIASIGVTQSYYTDEKLAPGDQFYRNPSMFQFAESKFSPVTIGADVSPIDGTNIGFAATYEHPTETIRQMSVSASSKIRSMLEMNFSWSTNRQAKNSELAKHPVFNNQTVSGSVALTEPGGRYLANYSISYDIHNSGLIYQAVRAAYNPQCCGFMVEYSKANLPNYGITAGRMADRRFNVTFTLAGIGSFSDFFGAFGADPYRR